MKKPKQQAAAPPQPVTIAMRLSAGKHAVGAHLVNGREIIVSTPEGRIAGGYGCVEFDLAVETWVDVTVLL